MDFQQSIELSVLQVHPYCFGSLQCLFLAAFLHYITLAICKLAFNFCHFDQYGPQQAVASIVILGQIYFDICLSIPTDLSSPPQTPSSTFQQYGRDSVTLTVQWQPPQYDGGAPVNYIITVGPGLSPVTTSGTSVPVTVPYNVIHTVIIVATNCNGSSSAAMVIIPAISELSCYPIFPYQDCNKLFRGAVAKVMGISMHHIQGPGGMPPRNFFCKIICLKIVSEAILAKNVISSIIFGKQDFGNYYTFHSVVASDYDCRLCVTQCMQQPLSIRLKVNSPRTCSSRNHCSHPVCHGPAYDKSCFMVSSYIGKGGNRKWIGIRDGNSYKMLQARCGLTKILLTNRIREEWREYNNCHTQVYFISSNVTAVYMSAMQFKIN